MILDEDDKRFYNKTERKSNSFRRGKPKKLKAVVAMQTIGDGKIKEYNSIEAKLSLRDKGEEFPKEMYDQYNALGKEITQIGGSLKKYENEIHKNKSDLGTAKQELDLFNRVWRLITS
jgi:hypothetical protein